LQLKGHNGHFVVAVKRLDTLIDTELHKALATRFSQVQLKFDVDSKGIMLNDMPVPLGISHLKVKAKTMTIAKVSNKDAINDFDEGIVDVKVFVKGFQITHHGITIRRIVLGEKVVQVNGHKVQQKTFVQQIMEIMPDGSVVRGPCHEVDAPDAAPHPAALPNHATANAPQQQLQSPTEAVQSVPTRSVITAHWKGLPLWARILTLVAHTFAMALVVFGVYSLLTWFVNWFMGYSRVASDDKAPLEQVETKHVAEKQPLVDN
jgi:hypothetical protein